MGDSVYLEDEASRALEGPFLIETVLPAPKLGKYTLCDENGEQVKEGREVDEKVLRIHKWGS